MNMMEYVMENGGGTCWNHSISIHFSSSLRYSNGLGGFWCVATWPGRNGATRPPMQPAQ